MDDNHYRNKLKPDEYKVLREKGTEPPFSGELLHEHRSGVFYCKACSQDLFASQAKFDSGSGWPSFVKPITDKSVDTELDNSHGMFRTELKCSNCGSHLGHVFEDGPQEHGGLRYCVNSLSLGFNPKSKEGLV